MADFNPYNSNLTPFRFWCQKVLPTEYDDSLSYYELLNKVVEKLNESINEFLELASFVNNATQTMFEYKAEIQQDFDDLATEFSDVKDDFNTLVLFVKNYFDNLDVQTAINDKLDEMASDGTLERLLADVSSTSDYINNVIAPVISEWLSNNITPTTPAVDNTLSVAGAAADSKAAGTAIRGNTDTLNGVKDILKAFLNNNAGNDDFEITPVWEFGGIGNGGGPVDTVGETRIRTNYIDISVFSKFVRSLTRGYAVFGYLYDKNKSPISGTRMDWSTDETYTRNIGENAKYVRFVLKDSEDGTRDLLLTEGSNLGVTGKWSYPGDISAYVNEYIDKTLSINGKGADAKVTGDRFKSLKDILRTFLNSKVGNNNYNFSMSWEVGGITNGGANAEVTNRIRTDYIDISLFSSYTRILSSGYEVLTAFYDENKTVIHGTVITYTSLPNYTGPINLAKYIRFALKNTSDPESDMSTDEGVNLSAYGSWSYPVDYSNYPYLSGKKAIFLGDSITYGLYSFWNGNVRENSALYEPNDRASKRITDYFAEISGMTVDNIATRGTGYVVSNSRDGGILNNALGKANITDFSQYDFVGLCYGINDWIQSEPLGNLTDKLEGTVIGNLCAVLDKIYSTNGGNPLCKVVIYTPYNAWGQLAYNQVGDNPRYYGDFDSNYAMGTESPKEPSVTYTLSDLIDAIKSVADYYGVTCTPLGSSNVVNRINIKDIMIDGLHPSLESYPMLAAEMYAQRDFG